MAINKIPINIDLKNKKFNNYVAQQNDNMLLDINIIENGVAKDLSKETLIVNYVNANNTIAVISGENVIVNGNNVKISCPNDCSRSNGQAKFSLVIKGADGQVSTYPIDITIEKGVIDGQAQSENIATIIEDLNNASLEATQKKNELEDVIKTADTTTYATKGEINGVKSDLEHKVNKEQGKGLSTNDYTTLEKQEVAKIKNKADTIRVDDLERQIGQGVTDEQLKNAVQAKVDDGTINSIQVGKDGIDTINLRDESVTAEKTDFIFEGKNKFDKNNIVSGKLISGAGLTNATNYGTSDYIRVYQGQQVTIQKCRCWQLTNDNKQYLDYNNTQNNNATVTLTPTVDGYLRISFALSSIDSVQVEYGDTATTYEKYKNFISSIELTDEQKKSVIPILNSNADIQVIKHGDIVDIKSKLSELEEIVVSTNKVGSRNGGFNFINIKINGVQVHEPTDDITPIRTFTTVGANHGYTCILEITQAGHDKTTVDLGSVWSDGVTEYVLLDINGDILTLGCPYVENDGIVSSVVVTPVTDLSHVSGATHITSISKSIIANSTQLYPSINNKTIKYILDGKEILEDGEYAGDKLQIVETYNIMDYKDIIDYAKSHIGVSFKNDDVKGVVKLSITYEFTKGCKCLISHSIKALRKVSLGACGFIQSSPTYQYNTFKRYIPNLKPKYGVDFEHIVDMENYSSNIYYNATSDFNDPSIPPHRVIDLIYNNNNELQYGFALGYIPDKTNSKNADRLANISEDGYYLNIRNTKKTYPNAIGTKVLNIGEYYTFECYRNYLSKYINATNINIVEDSQNTYVFIDYHFMITGMNIVLPKLIGKSITILESKNFKLMNDIVDSEGVTFNITSREYGYAVLKI